MKTPKIQTLSSFTWSIVEILRGDFKKSEYGKIILPFVVLRRLDCILRSSNSSETHADNSSKLTFAHIHDEGPSNIYESLSKYVIGFDASIRDIFLEKFLFPDQLKRLKDSNLLWQVFDRFCQIDFHPNTISNIEMGYLFEDLIRRFSEISNETAGEHFTPREVIRLITDLLLIDGTDTLTGSDITRTIYDPACGTGGMLVLMEETVKGLNKNVCVQLYGQELNPESFGVCKSDMLIMGHNSERIVFGNTLIEDAHKDKKFHYMLSNPPYGVDWKKYKDPIEKEASEKGINGRFGADLPRTSDGQLLFLQHMISKMRDDEAGSRIGIVMNASPLFTGKAGSGESEIRRWMLENDWVEAIIALPTNLFYNTDIQTYVWILTNRKHESRRSKVQLIDASSGCFWKSMQKSLGNKRREIPDKARRKIIEIYQKQLNGEAGWGEFSKILATTELGYREIRVERPLRLSFECTEKRLETLKRDKAFGKLSESRQQELLQRLVMLPKQTFKSREVFKAELKKALEFLSFNLTAPVKKAILTSLSKKDESADICKDTKGNIEADSDLRDHESVPLAEDWKDYIEREVKPFVPDDAWVDEEYKDALDGKVGRVGYEIPFNRYFYKYVPPRPATEIIEDIKRLEAEIIGLHRELGI